jgi:hypothetical protein
MENLVLEGDHINLPQHIVRKLMGKKIELIETEEGILIKPGTDILKETRGILKGSHFNSKVYFDQKRKEKELER